MIVPAILAIVLLTAAADVPARWQHLEAVFPIARYWAQPDDQHRNVSAPAPYDLLKRADGALPRNAAVLLVTSGRDVGRQEYITYHRALYFLAPRPIWWLSPAPPDGSWKSRWWIAAPLTPESVRAIAASKGASYVLAQGLEQELPIGRKIVETADGYLLQLAADATPSTPQPAPAQLAPIWPLQLVAAILAVVLTGGAALAAIARLGYHPRGIVAAALAWGLGAGLLSVLVLWLSLLGIKLDWQVALITLPAVAWGIVLVWRRQSDKREAKAEGRRQKAEDASALSTQHSALTSSHRLSPLQWLLVALLGAQVVVVALMAMGQPFQVWDSWANWGVKARIVFLDGYVSPAVYADPSRAVTHLDYPLLLPLSEAWLYEWLGLPDDRLAGVVSVLFYLALLGVCYSAVRGRGLDRTIALTATVALGTMAYVAGLASIVFAELPLMFLATMSGVYLVRWLEGGPAGTLAVAALGAGLMPWTKREGLVILAALCLGALLTNLRNRRVWAGVGVLVASACVLAGPWYVLIALNGITNAAFLPLTPANLLANLDRWPTIMELTWNSLSSFAWGYIWPLAFMGGLLTWRARKRAGPDSNNLLAATALLYVVMTGFMYLFSAFVPYEQHILASVDRLVAHVTPLVLLWIVFRGEPGVKPGSPELASPPQLPLSSAPEHPARNQSPLA